MDLYTLNSDTSFASAFLKNRVIDDFVSAIWTERFSKPGDIKLVVDATPENIALLAEGVFIGKPNTKEVMMIDTQSIEDKLLTVTGSSLLGIFAGRSIWTDDIDEVKNKVTMVLGKKPGELLAYIATLAAITPTRLVDHIAGLSLGSVDTSGSVITQFPLPFGSALEILQNVAETYSLGISMYLNAAGLPVVIDSPPYTYDLRFKVYKGIDRTNPANGPIVQFSPALDSLTNIKELRSIKDYKTHAKGLAPNVFGSPGDFFIWDQPAVPGHDFDTDFDKREMLVFMDDLTMESIGASNPAAPTAGDITLMYNTMAERTKNALANNNYIKVIDGEVVPQSQFQFGVHYNLGDIVELIGYTGFTQQAQITEYIRSQDETGERAYPTVSVIG